MQTIKSVFLFFTVLFFTACSTIKVETDYDPEFSFKNVSTYAIVHKSKEGANTLTDERIISAIHTRLKAKGYVKTKRSDADLLVVFHTDVRSKTRIVQDYQYVGISPYRYGYGGMMAVPTTRAYNYDEGKLLIDILNSKDKKIVWRGIATDSLKSYDTPQERTEYINKVMKSIFKTLPAKVQQK
jgi:hypothetical protein